MNDKIADNYNFIKNIFYSSYEGDLKVISHRSLLVHKFVKYKGNF